MVGRWRNPLFTKFRHKSKWKWYFVNGMRRLIVAKLHDEHWAVSWRRLNNFIIIIIEFIMIQTNRTKSNGNTKSDEQMLQRRQQQQMNSIHTLETNSMIRSERLNSMGFILHGWLQCENWNRNCFCWCFCCYCCCCCYCITEGKSSKHRRLAKFAGLFVYFSLMFWYI